MSHSLRVSIVLGLLGSFAAGYGLARWHGGSSRPPSRAVAGAAVPAGLASQLREALLVEDDFERTQRVAGILAPLGADALPDVRAAYDGVVLDLGDVELVLLMQWWGRFDPAGAFAWASESPVGWHPAVLAAVARSWGRADPQTAVVQMIPKMKDPRILGATLLGLARGWDESGQPGLMEFLGTATAESGESFALAVDALSRARILREGPQAAMAWADAMPDGPEGSPSPIKAFVAQRLAAVLVESDPALAAQWATAKRGPDYGAGLLLKVGVAWVEVDPEAAMAWLRSLPPGDDLPVVVQETYRKWFTNDMAAASRWLEAQTLAPWLDPALATYAQWKTRESFETAMEWAQKTSDPQRRKLTIGKIALAWLRESPEQADAWLAKAELPDATREHIATLRRVRIEKPIPGERMAVPPRTGPLAPGLPGVPPKGAMLQP